MPRFRRIAIPVITAATIAVATATSAYAADEVASSSDSCGVVGFYHYGDTFKFLDTCTDGRGVRLQATNPTTGTPPTSDFRVGLEDNGNYVSGTYGGWVLACAAQ